MGRCHSGSIRVLDVQRLGSGTTVLERCICHNESGSTSSINNIRYARGGGTSRLGNKIVTTIIRRRRWLLITNRRLPSPLFVNLSSIRLALVFATGNDGCATSHHIVECGVILVTIRFLVASLTIVFLIASQAMSPAIV